MPNRTKTKPVLPLIWLLIGLVLLLGSLLIVSNQVIGMREQNLFFAINDWPDALRWPFRFITYSGTIYAMAALTLFLIWRRRPRLALRVFVGGSAVFLITQLMKVMVQRPRPYLLLTGVDVREKLSPGYGYPSTHTAMVTVMALLLFIYLPAKWRWLPVVWTVLVALSRIYLGVHAPLDIVGGFAAGLVVVALSMLVQGKLAFVRNITHLKLSD